mmetsp:Transcript_54899/g.62869  ORF Transcript_54899/g.62869 Transcript_54899/m.62869 type:complete len:412 (+) Transcript_54899:83-1318(+)|eukprot:CAMPEP_0114974704 /NCGR_PEP_ID=MMETSP0216-20121206/1674_1 /TAXON_ID=223996 /ORGANISM="Protocruzia adherens, Strain Boccale" /LENGTH=411 /DNA_ID=CAMNT_0002335369 /DNA_START=63 /DNA_END=1298 /DNA_ORIENTATION=-
MSYHSTLSFIAVFFVLAQFAVSEPLRLDVNSLSSTSEGRNLSVVDLTLTSINDLYYTVSLGFGKNSKGEIVSIPVMIDTASPWVWAQSTRAESISLDPNAKIDITQIPSLHENGMAQSLSYRGGSASGAIAYVDLYVNPQTAVSSQTILVVSNFQNFPSMTSVGGVMGLGSPFAAKGYVTLLDSMFSAKIIPSDAFTLNLGSAATTGSLTFGEVSSEGVKKGHKLKYMDLNETYPQDTYYTITTDSFTLGTYVSDKGMYATIDSGNPFIGLPSNMWWQAIINEIPDDQCVGVGDPKVLMCKCGAFAGFPEMVISFGGMTWTFKPADYMVNMHVTGDYGCQLGIVANTEGFDRISLGALFLRHVVVAVDNSTNQLAIASNDSKLQPIYSGNSGSKLILSILLPLFVCFFGGF